MVMELIYSAYILVFGVPYLAKAVVKNQEFEKFKNVLDFICFLVTSLALIGIIKLYKYK